jgi:hypothetical protein
MVIRRVTIIEYLEGKHGCLANRSGQVLIIVVIGGGKNEKCLSAVWMKDRRVQRK